MYFFELIIHIFVGSKFLKKSQTRYIMTCKYKFLCLKIKSAKFKIIHNIHKGRRRRWHDRGDGSTLSLYKQQSNQSSTNQLKNFIFKEQNG